MNLLTLIHEQNLTLLSAKLVYSAAETGALQSVTATAESLAREHACASERILRATEEGRKQGYREGHAAGLLEGRGRICEQLLQMSEQYQNEVDLQRSQATKMALQIVRKVAAGIAPDEKLAALASVAAKECADDESISLRIHPAHSDNVRVRLKNTSDCSVARLVSVVADETLDEDGCVLETRYGSVVADLETQLRVIQRRLNGDAGG